MFAKLSLWLLVVSQSTVFHILRDALAGAVTAVVVLNLAIPGSLTEAKSEGLTVVTVFGMVFIKLALRNLTPWLLAKLATTSTPSTPSAAAQ